MRKHLPYLESAVRYAAAAFMPRHARYFLISQGSVSEVLSAYSGNKYDDDDERYMPQALLILSLACATQRHIDLLFAINDSRARTE